MFRGPRSRSLFRSVAVTVLSLTLFVLPAAASDTATSDADGEDRDDGPSVLHRVATYLPCRVLDLLDVVRLRARVGPGAAVGVRATEVADFFIGSYWSLYAGLPGPRGRRMPKLPVGFESLTGLEVSVVDLTMGAGAGPGYSATEFGIGIQTLVVGVDAGFDPVELADFFTGLFLVDLRDDDF
jgi:hypothetical protein